MHREHRLIPALVTVEAFLIDVRHSHDTYGACGWCDPAQRLTCWAHNLARTMLGGRVS